MYRTKDGEEIFVIDAHIAAWDASKENQLNKYGEHFIDCFYDYHQISPEEYLWLQEKFYKYDADTVIKDVILNGYSDMAIFQPVFLKEFYKNGFANFQVSDELLKRYPDRFIFNISFDPRHEEKGLEELEAMAKKYNCKGAKLYTADWYKDSKGYKLTDPWAQKYLEKCQELGIKNIHVHKGPTIRPLNRDAFDVADVDDAASSFPELNFIVEHVGLPRLEDFCWIAKQDKNIYAGLSVAIAFIHQRPRYFGEIMSELLYWLGEDRIIFGSDYAIWEPKWIVEKFIDFEIPEDILKETGVTLDMNVKKKILAENVAKLYDIDIEAQKLKLKSCDLSSQIISAPAPTAKV